MKARYRRNGIRELDLMLRFWLSDKASNDAANEDIIWDIPGEDGYWWYETAAGQTYSTPSVVFGYGLTK